LTGDSIRGKIHGETFYGAIKQAKKDDNGNILRDNTGKMIIGDTIYYVIRKELTYKKKATDSGFKTWEDIETVIVDKVLIKRLQQQYQGKTFNEACEEGLYLEDKKGIKRKIRHIRCYTSVKNPLAIKDQTYLSDKTYKNKYYAEVGDLYVMCKYKSENDKIKEYVIYSLFDICKNRENYSESIPKIYNNKYGVKLYLDYILKSGMRIIITKEDEDVRELDKDKLLRRLYVISGFENDGSRIIIKNHLCAKEEKVLGKGESVKDYDHLPDKIRCSINTLSYLIEGINFEISQSGVIKFYKQIS